MNESSISRAKILDGFTSQTPKPPQPLTYTLIGTPKIYGFFKVHRKFSEYGKMAQKV
jgi:hypothetical protein